MKTETVKVDHMHTPYAGRASLHLGQLYAKTGDYDKSIPELSWAAENATELSIQSLAHYALAYIFIAKEDAQKAKLAAESIASPGYTGLKSDLLGDIALMNEDNEAARTFFNQALNFYKNKSELAQVIQTKLDAIGAAPETINAAFAKPNFFCSFFLRMSFIIGILRSRSKLFY